MLGGVNLKSQSGLTDVELLRQLKWLPGKDSKVMRKAAARGDVVAFVLAARSRLQPFADRLSKRIGPKYLCLMAGTELPPDGLAGRFAMAGDGTNVTETDLGEVLSEWLALQRTGVPIPDSDSALMLQLLLTPPIDTQVDTYLRLWRLALTVITARKRAKGAKVFADATAAASRLAGALVFAQLEGSQALLTESRETLGNLLLDITDTDGTPAAAVVTNMRSWLATFLLAAEFSRAFKVALFQGATADRYRLFVRRAIEVSADDHLAFELRRTTETKELLRLAAKSAGWSSDTEIGALARRSKRNPKKASKDFPAVQSDWARFAFSRSDYRPDADLLAVTHDEPTPKISLSCLGEPVLSGQWRPTLTVNGKKIDARGDWDCTCWHSDKDGEYIELQWTRQRLRIDRQIFLSRKHRFAILMDSAVARRNSRVRLEMTLPLAPSVMSQADFVSREWRLHADTIRVRAFPVSLDFDRVHHALGEFVVESDVMRYAVNGQQATQAALVLDWHPKRLTSDTDWQPLTVTENRQPLTTAQAAAFRLRVGKHQIVSYRNIDGGPALRAVMGHHSDHETVIGRFTRKGLEPLVLVDQ